MAKILSEVLRDDNGLLCSDIDWDVEMMLKGEISQCDSCGTIFYAEAGSRCPVCGAETRESRILADPVEWTEEYKAAYPIVEKEVDRLIPEEKRFFGSCHSIWNTEKRLLKEHGIDWKTPDEMNPLVMFD